MRLLARAVNIIILCYGYLLAGSIGFYLGGILGLIIAIATAPLSIIFAAIYTYVTVGNLFPIIVIAIGILSYLLSTKAMTPKRKSVYELIED